MRELRLEIPFQAYPWFPVPDALTREQPDGALAGPPDVIHPPYALFRDARPPIPKRFGQRLAGSVLSGFHLFFCHCAETLSYTALNC